MNNNYPEINFLETDAEKILTELIALFEDTTKKTLQPASPERLFVAWCAAVIVQQRVIINETAKQNVPRYAKGENLDSLAELFKDTERLPASAAVTTVRCHISEKQTSSVFIPAGTRVTADGEIMFATTELLEIPAGSLYGDVEAVCQTPGEVGNGFEAGQVKEIVDVYDYYQKIENITRTSGGAAEEKDEDYYERLRESMESFSTAGPINAYIYWTKSISAAIADVAVTSPEPGEVDVRVLMKDGQEATETILKEIEAGLNSEDIRPLTDMVTVSRPEEDSFSVNVKYYIPTENASTAAMVSAAAAEAVEKYVKWQTEKMGRDINPSKLISLMMEAGVKRVDVIEPTFKVVQETHVAKISGTPTVVNGGIEDE